MSSREPLSVAIEGVIGVGKTSLASTMAVTMGAHLLLEDDLPNPFLERFYRNRSRWSLATQLQFLDQRLRQFAAPRPAGMPVVADHTIDRELLFAQVTMDDDEFALYRSLFVRLAPSSGFQPRVVIYLTADVDSLLAHIRERGRDAEGAIDRAYLEQLHHQYHGWFTGPAGERQRIVVVDADAAFIARDPAAVQRLIEACHEATHGISYCNPIG